MIHSEYEIFQSRSLAGDFLVAPWRSYKEVFENKIDQSPWGSKTRIAWIAAYIITGIVAYPIFGVLFYHIGMYVKRAGIPSLLKHNASTSRDLMKLSQTISAQKPSFQQDNLRGQTLHLHLEFKTAVKDVAEAEKFVKQIFMRAVERIEGSNARLERIFYAVTHEPWTAKKAGNLTLQLKSDFSVPHVDEWDLNTRSVIWTSALKCIPKYFEANAPQNQAAKN
jgi:hypothetical protein